jgi:hypothetical protein
MQPRLPGSARPDTQDLPTVRHFVPTAATPCSELVNPLLWPARRGGMHVATLLVAGLGRTEALPGPASPPCNWGADPHRRRPDGSCRRAVHRKPSTTRTTGAETIFARRVRDYAASRRWTKSLIRWRLASQVLSDRGDRLHQQVGADGTSGMICLGTSRRKRRKSHPRLLSATVAQHPSA